MLYFVVRTDVDKDSGLQRVFGCGDTWDEADTLRAQLASTMRGVFAVFGGTETPSPAVPIEPG